MHGCGDCKYCKVYRSNSYWDPDEAECVGFDRDIETDLTAKQLEDLWDRAWSGEEWHDDEDQICPAWEEVEYNEWD